MVFVLIHVGDILALVELLFARKNSHFNHLLAGQNIYIYISIVRRKKLATGGV